MKRMIQDSEDFKGDGILFFAHLHPNLSFRPTEMARIQAIASVYGWKVSDAIEHIVRIGLPGSELEVKRIYPKEYEKIARSMGLRMTATAGGEQEAGQDSKQRQGRKSRRQRTA